MQRLPDPSKSATLAETGAPMKLGMNLAWMSVGLVAIFGGDAGGFRCPGHMPKSSLGFGPAEPNRIQVAVGPAE